MGRHTLPPVLRSSSRGWSSRRPARPARAWFGGSVAVTDVVPLRQRQVIPHHPGAILEPIPERGLPEAPVFGLEVGNLPTVPGDAG
jgi:hypothetical protein